MPTQLQIRAWVTLRRAGFTCAEIATQAKVSAGLVSAATGPYGPWGESMPKSWERAAQTSIEPDVRVAAWVAARRRGEQVRAIASAAGVPAQAVSRATSPWGPFPRVPPVSTAQAASWAAERRAGTSVKAIAARDGVSKIRVANATRPHGPFIPSRCRTDTLSLRGVARLLGVAPPVVARWRDDGHLPAPIEGTNPPQWDPDQITTWAQATLARCPVCTALVRDLGRHTGNRH